MTEENIFNFSLVKEQFFAYEYIEGQIFIREISNLKSKNFEILFKGKEIIKSLKEKDNKIPNLNKKIFSQNLQIPLSNKINKNDGFLIPFKFKLTDKTIPGSFFFFDEQDLFLAEIIYTLTIKIDNLYYKDFIILIENKENFNVFKDLNTFKILEKCCKKNRVEMSVSNPNEYVKINDNFSIELSINNTKNNYDGEEVYIELNKKIKIYPNEKNKTLEINIPIFSIQGKDKIKKNKIYSETFDLKLKSEQKIPPLNYIVSSEYFKFLKGNSSLLTKINQSILSGNIICEYSLMIWSCFLNFDYDDISIYFPLIVFPSQNLCLKNIKPLDTISEDDFEDIQISTNEEETQLPNFL